MPVHVEELDKWQRKLRIALPETEVEKKVGELYTELAKTAQVPGFRKGKVPRSVLERRHGDRVKAEAMESLMRRAYVEALEETGLRPICDPLVEDMGTSPSDGHYHFTATIEVYPEVELKDYESLEFTEKVPVVANDDVDRALEELRERNADLVSVTRPAREGDFVIIDYDRLDENGGPIANTTVEDYPCEVGKGQLPPELEEALSGASAGDEKTVAVSYPDDYRVESMAGKTISFGVGVKDVKEKRLPRVDDDFAKAVGGAETVLDLRVKIRNALEGQAKGFARRRLEEEIVSALIERNPFDLPERLVEARLDRMRSKMTEGHPEGKDGIAAEEFSRVYRSVVEHQLKAGFVLRALAERHSIEVTREDVEGRVAEIAESQGKEPATLLEDLKDTEALSQIEDDIWLSKVHDLIVELSSVKTEFVDVPKTPKPSEPESGGGESRQAD